MKPIMAISFGPDTQSLQSNSGGSSSEGCQGSDQEEAGADQRAEEPAAPPEKHAGCRFGSRGQNWRSCGTYQRGSSHVQSHESETGLFTGLLCRLI